MDSTRSLFAREFPTFCVMTLSVVHCKKPSDLDYGKSHCTELELYLPWVIKPLCTPVLLT